MKKRTRLRYSIQALGQPYLWWYTPQRVWLSERHDHRVYDPVTQAPIYRQFSSNAYADTFNAALRIARKIGKGYQARIVRYEVQRKRVGRKRWGEVANWIVEGE